MRSPRPACFLLSELYCLGHDTDSTVIIASRMQCDRRDFHSDFVYYTIDPVSDEQIIRWLERDAALRMIGGDERNRSCEIRRVPGRLLEVLRTPLFYSYVCDDSSTFSSAFR